MAPQRTAPARLVWSSGLLGPSLVTSSGLPRPQGGYIARISNALITRCDLYVGHLAEDGQER